MSVAQQQMPQADLSQTSAFGNFDDSQQFSLDFSTLENPDVLENFDFDSFLNQNGDDQFGFEASIGDGGAFNLDPSVE